MALVVALLGGESTGKTSLAQALCDGLNEGGLATGWVPEHLRKWCELHGRAPRAEEQTALAREQGQLTEAMARRSDLQIVVADTSPLVIAAYSEIYFGDTSLLQETLAWQRKVDMTLLMGLDLPWVPDGLFRDGVALRDATDAILRRELQQAGIPFQTIHGSGTSRTEQALRTIGRRFGLDLGGAEPHWQTGRRPWSCDNCSDPECEHRLFSGLLATDTPGKSTP